VPCASILPMLTMPLPSPLARQHRLTELVRQVSQARLAGDEGKAQTLLAEARELDPGSPLVLEHSEPPLSSTTNALQSAAAGQAASSAGAGGTRSQTVPG